ncbi:hypothetical protein GCM10010981_46520 [Dyella nitratireducens]|uniref:Uncharacterized protein n=1 Tax=Dyella nitratireducens TaxID=1849580 RepID=A0ABQ1GWH4_9GAMM|nr:hypothetical protein GCM10010981_46520 [Dyella nitratireducens]
MDDMPSIAMSMGMERETTGISTISAMAAKASHATNLCCAERFNTFDKPWLGRPCATKA